MWFCEIIYRIPYLQPKLELVETPAKLVLVLRVKVVRVWRIDVIVTKDH